MKVGYARVSTREQNIDTQIVALRDAGVEKIVQEKVSGVGGKQEKLLDMLQMLVAGDTLVVTRMDRLGRNTKQLLELTEDLANKSIYLSILDLGIDTSKPTGKFIMTVMAAFSELDRTMIKEKQQAGIAVAKQKGVYKGRRKTYNAYHVGMNHALELRETTNKSVAEICQITGISRASFYRRLAEIRQETERKSN